MSRTVELAIVALIRPANKSQTALPVPGLPKYQGAQYRVQIIDAEDGADIYSTFGLFEVEQSTFGDAGERLASMLRAPLTPCSKVVEERQEMKLVGGKRGYLARAAAKLIADRVPATDDALNDYCEHVRFDADCIKALNQALEPYDVGVLAVASAA